MKNENFYRLVGQLIYGYQNERLQAANTLANHYLKELLHEHLKLILETDGFKKISQVLIYAYEHLSEDIFKDLISTVLPENNNSFTELVKYIALKRGLDTQKGIILKSTIFLAFASKKELSDDDLITLARFSPNNVTQRTIEILLSKMKESEA